MSVEEKERVIVRETKPKNRVEEPQKFQAVYRQNSSRVCDCNIELLTDVFNITAADALGHIRNAISYGRQAVMVGSRDLIETKVGKANSKAQDPRACFLLGLVTLACEPL